MPQAPKKKVTPRKKVKRKKSERPKVLSTGSGSSASFPIVSIGASAGGLEAFSNLLRALPKSLASPLSSSLISILPMKAPWSSCSHRTTEMPVLQAAEGQRVRVSTVYVLPPNSDVTIAKGVLRLVRRAAGRGHHMPIDMFFRSLAEDQTSNAIGVILSGTANDGTLGMAAIKNSGGITLAQDESAKYDGMPHSAVASGVVDLSSLPQASRRNLPAFRRDPRKENFPVMLLTGKNG